MRTGEKVCATYVEAPSWRKALLAVFRTAPSSWRMEVGAHRRQGVSLLADPRVLSRHR